ncbi:VOC family protein [Leifsonia sp. ZF2019]|uniref:VOC family protein n=1 Tax=Leifsonia sp. ZF2019 TaxID=2781978 RepID=UPI001CBA86AB|nr:VOC family protein [Leifsonia sp. ZF2019]UAJ80225.1 VOC family protein [Leifsonia sp. ZF2019]
MDLAATRIFTDDVDGMVAFYERVTGLGATRRHPLFAELVTPSGTLAIASTRTVAAMGDSGMRAADNHSVCLDFRVGSPDAVDAAHRDLSEGAARIVQEPADMPWGNRSLLIADPDGNLVNVFAPLAAG